MLSHDSPDDLSPRPIGPSEARPTRRAAQEHGERARLAVRTEESLLVADETVGGGGEFEVTALPDELDEDPVMIRGALFGTVKGTVVDFHSLEAIARGEPVEGPLDVALEPRLESTDVVAVSGGPEGVLVVRRLGEEEIDWQLIDSDVVGGPAALHTDHNSRGNPVATVHGSGELHITGLTPDAPGTRASPLEAVGEPAIGGAYGGPLMTLAHAPDGTLWVEMDGPQGVETAQLAEDTTGPGAADWTIERVPAPA